MNGSQGSVNDHIIEDKINFLKSNSRIPKIAFFHNFTPIGKT